MDKIETIIARIFSSVFHPLVVPTLGIFILFSLNTYISFSIPSVSQRIILLIVIFNTAIAPVVSIFMLKRMKIVKSILLESRAERIIPVFITGLFYFFTFWVLKQAQLPFIIYFFILSATIIIFLVLIITFHWKISIHMTSIGGLTGFLVSASMILKTEIPIIIISAIIISGLLGYSRIKLKAHTPTEIYAGFILGFSLIIILTIIFT
ncbi:MAG: hypothetical protein KGZ97_10245 [Bacteroidetes bacterium]|nr:hypothetical protein [Bacteroidota bacterium]